MFDSSYYSDIWPTQGVHRHDYCESVANHLIAKYNPSSVLDIGTGCGYLVKVLRERGVDAWGLEISEYAVENSHGYVLHGDVRDIPFKDGRFDLVYSQGLWEYLPESDIQKAWLEVNRVGKLQEHNIDTTNDTADWTLNFATHKPKEWWDERLVMPKILVACPNHEVKEYAFQRWIDKVKSFTYPNFDIFVVDNSPNSSDFMNRYKDQVPMVHIDTTGIEDLMVLRLNLSYERIREEFLAGDYERLYVVESDIIPPKDMTEFMLRCGRDTDWISHAYPMRGETVNVQQGIGCSMFTRRVMEAFNFKDFADLTGSDSGLWEKVRHSEFQTMELWGYRPLEHLKEPA